MKEDFYDGAWPFVKWVALFIFGPVLALPFGIINGMGLAVFEGLIETFWKFVLFQ